MKLGNISFPHPVLGIKVEENETPEVNGLYNIRCEHIIQEKTIFKINHRLINAIEIDNLIQNGHAIFVTEVSSSKTAYRKSFKSSAENQIVEIDTDNLRDLVVLNFFIIANNSFIYCDNEDVWHPDYKGAQFEISKGMPLAYGGQIKIIIERGNSSGGIRSLFNVETNNEKNGPFSVWLESETIDILVPEKAFSNFSNLYENQPGYDETFHAALAVPALYEALLAMRDDQTLHNERRWYQALEAKLEADFKYKIDDLDGADLLQIAQKIINNPFTSLTESLIQIENTEED
jgi:hypothetical protein